MTSGEPFHLTDIKRGMRAMVPAGSVTPGKEHAAPALAVMISESPAGA